MAAQNTLRFIGGGFSSACSSPVGRQGADTSFVSIWIVSRGRSPFPNLITETHQLE